MNQDVKRSVNELARAYSVIVYEFEALERVYTLYQYALELHNRNLLRGDALLLQYCFNEIIVLFCVHARNLANLFSINKRKREDDIKITDFGLKYDIFNTFDSRNLDAIIERVSKEVSHLTYWHLKETNEREWDISFIFKTLKGYFNCFYKQMELNNKSIVEKSIEIDKSFIEKGKY